MKILLVDDSKDVLFVNKTILKRIGYDVEVANNGQEAWEKLLKEEYRIIICDWMMPVMDGLTLCKKIRDYNFKKYIFFMLLTAKKDNPSIIESFESGVDDFISKPVQIDELKARLKCGGRVIDLEDKMHEKNQILKEFEVHIKEQLNMAAKTLGMILPKQAEFSNYSFKWIFQPAEYLGGDIFSYFEIGEKKMIFYLIDVSGHGISSALVSLMINSILRQNKEMLYTKGELVSPAIIAERLNESLKIIEESMIYCTLVLGIVEKDTGKITFTQAAHPSPIILRKNGLIEEVGVVSPPVGLLPNSTYEDCEIYLNDGDQMIIYTDGITDILDEESNKLFDETKLKLYLSELAGKPLDKILHLLEKKVMGLSAGTPQDDMSILAIEKM